MNYLPVPVGNLTETQEAVWREIFEAPRAEQAEKLLKWALSRLTFHGPVNEPCANAIRAYFGDEQEKGYDYRANRGRV